MAQGEPLPIPPDLFSDEVKVTDMIELIGVLERRLIALEAQLSDHESRITTLEP